MAADAVAAARALAGRVRDGQDAYGGDVAVGEVAGVVRVNGDYRLAGFEDAFEAIAFLSVGQEFEPPGVGGGDPRPPDDGGAAGVDVRRRGPCVVVAGVVPDEGDDGTLT